MKSISLVVAALLLPLAAAAQTDILRIRCLPQAQQDEITAKASVIYESAKTKRDALGPAVGPGHRVTDARKTKIDWEEAHAACMDKAKAAGRGPEACEREAFHVRIATKALADITANTDAMVVIDAEQDRLLQELRKNYPACGSTVGTISARQ